MGDIQPYRRADRLAPHHQAPGAHVGAERAAHDIRSQVHTEIAGVKAIVSCGEAVAKLPANLPASQRRMAERIAINAAHMIRRLAQ